MVVMVGFMLTKGVSFLQALIIADRFGAGAEYDTFVLGSQLPDYLVRLIGGGALGVAFIPVFSALLNDDDNEGAWRLASQVFNTLLLTAMTVSLFVFIFAPLLVKHIIAPGLNDAEMAQTADVMRILSVGTVIFSVSGILSGVLHGHNHFFLPVLAPIFQDVGLLIGVIVLTGPFGIHGLAWGTLLGAVMHFAIQIPGLFMFKVRWKPLFGWNDPKLRQVIKLMLPRAMIGAAFLVNLIVIGNISSQIGEGAASAFSWALRFMDIPQALIGTATGIVIFPTLSALNSMGKIEERRAAFAGALRFILVASIPAAAGLVLVVNPALHILFDADESARIFTAVQIMSLAIIIQSLHEILTRAFYAQQDTLRPLIFSVIATVITVITVVGMYQIYKATDPPLWSPLAVGGPALGYVVSFLVEVILLATVLRKRWGDIALPELMNTAARTIAATLAMAIAVLVVDQVLITAGFGEYDSKVTIVMRVGVLVLVGGVTWLTAAWFIRVQELREIPGLLRARQVEDLAASEFLS
jgi:putative peptidoglycan lipid II flippase